MSSDEIRRSVEAVWRIESGKIVAGLARLVRDVGRAEELAQDAFVAALEQWPTSGIPRNPGAWLMTAGKRRAVDQLRRRPMLERTHAMLARDVEARQRTAPADMDALDDEVGDERLSLMFTACHPVLPKDARVALTLRLLCGLTTEEIARAYLVPEPTVAQRLVRAKRTLAKAQVPFEVPDGKERQERLSSVLEVVYLVFTEGYTATSGDAWVRPTLCQEAVRLARILAELAPHDAEVHGLVSLLELQSSRLKARVDGAGKAVRLNDQLRSAWDQLLIRRGLTALARAEALEGTPGPYRLQAAIAACHARALSPGDTDWERIAQLYAVLAEVTQSPIVELNRAVAVSMAFGPSVALELIGALAEVKALQQYHLFYAVRGDLLEKLGRHDEARAEFARAAALTANQRERELLLERSRDCGQRVG